MNQHVGGSRRKLMVSVSQSQTFASSDGAVFLQTPLVFFFCLFVFSEMSVLASLVES